MVVILRDREEVRVDQQPHPVSVESGEHLTDVREPHLSLVEHSPLLRQENTVGDGGVDVPLRLVVQTHHVAFGDKVEHDGREEGEEADDSTEHSLHSPALSAQVGVQQDVGHEEETGSAGAVGERLHSSDGSAQTPLVDELSRGGVSTGGQAARQGTRAMPGKSQGTLL